MSLNLSLSLEKPQANSKVLNVYMLLLDFFLSKRDVFEIISKMDSAVNGNAY